METTWRTWVRLLTKYGHGHIGSITHDLLWLVYNFKQKLARICYLETVLMPPLNNRLQVASASGPTGQAKADQFANLQIGWVWVEAPL